MCKSPFVPWSWICFYLQILIQSMSSTSEVGTTSLPLLYGHKIQLCWKGCIQCLYWSSQYSLQDWCACYENAACLQIFQEALKYGQRICRYRKAAIDKPPTSMKRADLRRASLMVSQQNILQTRSVLLTSFPHEFIWIAGPESCGLCSSWCCWQQVFILLVYSSLYSLYLHLIS